jgi:LacI family transcriptional regulator
MRERLDGAHDALAPADAPYDTRLVRDGICDPAAAARIVAELLDQPDPPTAFFSLNNRITLGVIEELCRRGSDAALLGFDDFDMARLVPYPLTVIAYDTRELARTATELLFRRIGGDRSWPRTVVLPTELDARGARQQRTDRPSLDCCRTGCQSLPAFIGCLGLPAGGARGPEVPERS